MKLYGFKPLKPPKNFDLKSSSAKKFVQIIILSLRVLLESRFKAFKNFKNSKQSKLHRIQALKPRRAYKTNLIKSRNIWRTHEEHEECEEQEISNKLIPDIYRNFVSKIFQSTFQSKWRQFVFKSRPHWCNTWIEYFSKDIESEDYSIVL